MLISTYTHNNVVEAYIIQSVLNIHMTIQIQPTGVNSSIHNFFSNTLILINHKHMVYYIVYLQYSIPSDFGL